VITETELAELAALLRGKPDLRTIRTAVALKPPRPPRALKPPPIPRDRHEARLKANVSRFRNRVDALAELRAALVAAVPRSTAYWSLSFDAIEYQSTEHSDVAGLKAAEEALTDYLARQPPP
jgi:hypothetical protein